MEVPLPALTLPLHEVKITFGLPQCPVPSRWDAAWDAQLVWAGWRHLHNRIMTVHQDTVPRFRHSHKPYTMSREQTYFWNNESDSDRQDIPIWKLRTHHHVYTGSAMDPMPSQLNQTHTLTSCFSKMHFNIILPSTPVSLKWSFRFSLYTSVTSPFLDPNICFNTSFSNCPIEQGNLISKHSLNR